MSDGMRKQFLVWSSMAFACLAICLSGCPDYSHQREVPNYEKMVDGGEGEVEDGEDEE